jgi:N utilization substance protein B
MRSARRRSREYAVQGLYAWLMTHDAVGGIEAGLMGDKDFEKADAAMFTRLLRGAVGVAPELDGVLAPALDRKPDELSPVEHAILLLAAFELRDTPEVPYRVIINEAVELAKSFGGTDGHKYVNGVLDKLARSLRAHEAARARA